MIDEDINVQFHRASDPKAVVEYGLNFHKDVQKSKEVRAYFAGLLPGTLFCGGKRWLSKATNEASEKKIVKRPKSAECAILTKKVFLRPGLGLKMF